MNLNQRTIKNTTTFKGIGLHSGNVTSVTLIPAPSNTGVVFRRIDLNIEQEKQVSYDSITDTTLCTCFSINDRVKVNTIEHFMAALSLLGIDNIIVELDNEEFPIMDGSAISFVYLLREIGIEELYTPKKFLRIKKTILTKIDDKIVEFSPTEDLALNVDYEIDFDNPYIKKTNQKLSINLFSPQAIDDICRARTFGFMKDIEIMRSMGLGKGGSTSNAIIVDDYKIINDSPLRYDDEFVRHKILDLVGDLYVSGFHIIGNIKVFKGGHNINNKSLINLFSEKENYSIIEIGTSEEVEHIHQEGLGSFEKHFGFA